LVGPDPDKAFAIVADLTTMDGIRAAAEATYAHFGRVDVLINNAGMTNSLEFLQAEPEALARTVDLNLRAMVVLTRLVAERMAAQHSGHIVNITSLAGVVGLTGRRPMPPPRQPCACSPFPCARSLRRTGSG
jgi:NAD(P)-dependent dehydrogenase (short-subunit alcohol dehydrogenase family)